MLSARKGEAEALQARSAALTDELDEKLREYSALLRGGDRDALLRRLTESSDRKKAFDRLRSPAPSKTPLYK